jgi:hypothetical protein
MKPARQFKKLAPEFAEPRFPLALYRVGLRGCGLVWLWIFLAAARIPAGFSF